MEEAIVFLTYSKRCIEIVRRPTLGVEMKVYLFVSFLFGGKYGETEAFLGWPEPVSLTINCGGVNSICRDGKHKGRVLYIYFMTRHLFYRIE